MAGFSRESLLNDLSGGGSVPGETDDKEPAAGEVPKASEVSEVGEDEDEASEAGPGDPGEQVDEDAADETEQDEEEESETPGEAGPAPENESSGVSRKEFAEFQQQILQVLALAAGQKQQPAPAPSPDPLPEIPENVLRLALFGGDQALVDKVPKDTWAKAVQVADEHATKLARYALNPRLRYEQEIRKNVLEDVFQVLSPLMSDYHERMAKDTISKTLGQVKDPQVQNRARAIYQTKRGAKSTEWSDQFEAWQAAVAEAKLEAIEAQSKAKDTKNQVQKLQRNAAGGGKLKGRSAPAGGASNKALPKLQKGESLESYAERIKPLL